MQFRAVVAAVVFVSSAVPALAQQQVNLQFHNGQVTLTAQNAPVRAVLAEWARLGGATIVNGDRVAGPPVTLELNGVSEREALDVLLRSVAGYMLAPRPPGSSGPSAFDRIMILPTSAAPRNPPPAPTSAAVRPPVVRPPIMMPQPGEYPVAIGGLEGLPEGFPIEGFPEDPTMGAETGAEQMPIVRPGMPRIGAPRMVMPPQPLGTEPRIVTFDGTEEPQEEMPPDAGIGPTPMNPFGIPAGSSAMPGVIAPVPEPQPADGIQ